MPAKLTTQEFINRARAVHGDKYGYAFSVYQSSREKVMIHCPDHGIFEQSPNSHFSGKGCPVCSGKKKHTNESFIEKAKAVHGDRYDYSLVEYKNNNEKVTIVCTEHGEFEQKPNHHLSGKGCPGCSGNKKLTNESFIQKARETHGENTYDYSKIKYKSSKSKISIVCPEHGDFEQRPDQHLAGNGCPSCGDKIRAEARRYDDESFIQKAREVHGDQYDYSKVDYIHSKNKVTIYCREHGVFEQTPDGHLHGNGCPGCADYGFDRTKVGFLYVLRSECGRYMKIGITNKPNQRQVQLSRATPFSFKRIELVEGTGDKIANLEKELLSCYQPAGFTETFDGSTEWRLWNESVRGFLLC